MRMIRREQMAVGDRVTTVQIVYRAPTAEAEMSARTYVVGDDGALPAPVDAIAFVQNELRISSEWIVRTETEVWR